MDKCEQAVRRRQLRTRFLDIADEPDDRPLPFAVAPQGEGVAVRVEEVGQPLELAPLRLVVLVLELLGIGALAGCLELDEAGEALFTVTE